MAVLLVSLTFPAVASANVSFTVAYAWGVRDGTSQFETCTNTSTCRTGLAGGSAGRLDDPAGIATDSSGNDYVANFNQRIDEFSSGR